MGKLAYERIGGQVVHVGDCQVWAEIFYLDSSTDYREYLPQKSDVRTTDSGEDLAMLGELHSRWNIRGAFWLLSIPILFFVGFIVYFAFGA